jgi:hypothetical protein
MKNNSLIHSLWIVVMWTITTSPAIAGQFSAGFATSDISPKKGEQMLTILNGPQLTNKIDDPIQVKALVFSMVNNALPL